MAFFCETLEFVSLGNFKEPSVLSIRRGPQASWVTYLFAGLLCERVPLKFLDREASQKPTVKEVRRRKNLYGDSALYGTLTMVRFLLLNGGLFVVKQKTKSSGVVTTRVWTTQDIAGLQVGS